MQELRRIFEIENSRTWNFLNIYKSTKPSKYQTFLQNYMFLVNLHQLHKKCLNCELLEVTTCKQTRHRVKKGSFYFHFRSIWWNQLTVSFTTKIIYFGWKGYTDFYNFNIAQCRNYRNLLSHLFDKTFLKATLLKLLNKEMISRNIFSCEENFSFFHTVVSWKTHLMVTDMEVILKATCCPVVK